MKQAIDKHVMQSQAFKRELIEREMEENSALKQAWQKCNIEIEQREKRVKEEQQRQC